jgi:surfeit locus 1 family protein
MQRPAPSTAAKAMSRTKGRARLLLSVVTVLAMSATAGLGVWQLKRAAFKETLAAQIESQSKQPALQDIALPERTNSINEAAQTTPAPAPAQAAAGKQRAVSAQALLHRRTDLRGTWLHQHTVFLDNRFMGGRPGFFVATPLLLDNQLAGAQTNPPSTGKRVVWVQRGWAPRDPMDRTRLPRLPAPTEPVSVQGRVVAEVSRVYALGGPEVAAKDANAVVPAAPQTASGQPPIAPGAARDWRIVQNLSSVDFGPSVQLLPVAVLQTGLVPGDAPDGLQRDWLPLDSGVAKHYGYAFQWFALCGLIMLLYAWFQFFAPRRRAI